MWCNEQFILKYIIDWQRHFFTYPSRAGYPAATGSPAQEILQGSANPQTPGSENKRIKSCVLLPAAGRRTQLFHLIFTEPGVCGFAELCIPSEGSARTDDSAWTGASKSQQKFLLLNLQGHLNLQKQKISAPVDHRAYDILIGDSCNPSMLVGEKKDVESRRNRPHQVGNHCNKWTWPHWLTNFSKIYVQYLWTCYYFRIRCHIH